MFMLYNMNVLYRDASGLLRHLNEMKFDNTDRDTIMDTTCDQIHAEIQSLLDKTDDDDTTIVIRAKATPRQYTYPPRPRKWPLRGFTRGRAGQGYINTWDLKDEQGKDIRFCYVQDGRLGIPSHAVEKSTVSTYDHELPEDTCERIITTVHICPLKAFDLQESTAIYAALQRLFHTAD